MATFVHVLYDMHEWVTERNGTDFRRVLVNLDRGLYRILY